MNQNRRKFVRHSIATGTGIILFPSLWSSCTSSGEQNEASATTTPVANTESPEMFFKISLAQWSLHKTLFAGDLDNLDFAAKTKNDFGIEAVEYVNQFFKDKAEDKQYISEMKQRAADLGVTNVLIMIDGEGGLGALDDAERMQAVENHYKWVEAAQQLGCHSIRVNAQGNGSPEEVAKGAVDGLGKLAEFAKDYNIGVIVENHGGPSSNGKWLSGVLEEVGMDNCGSLPDFGNFCIRREGGECAEDYDRYRGVEELMPFAKGVSAKSHDFNEQGAEIHTDYMKMMKIVKDAGYTGYVGVEYEGRELSEEEGIMKTKELLIKIGQELS